MPFFRICLLAGAFAPCGLLAQSATTLVLPGQGAHQGARGVALAADTTIRFRFDIPAQPLHDALVRFGHQTGLRVETRGDVSPAVQSSPVTGLLTAPEALRLLLSRTGFSARFRDEDRVVLSRVAPGDSVHGLAMVVVTTATRRAGYAPRSTVFATRSDVPLRDVPQSVTVVSRQQMTDQAMQSMAEVARYIPGITMGQGEGHRDAPTIRGNASTADFFIDGVRDDAQYLRDLYNVERVEVLKGSNAMVFGRGGGGGVINRVNKQAQWTPTGALTVEGGSFDHRRATGDIGQGISHVAGRVNGMYEDSRLFRDATRLERAGVSPTGALLVKGTLVRFGYERFSDRRTVDRGIPSFRGRPSDAPITTFFGDPALSHARSLVNAAGVTIERGRADGLLVRNQTRFIGYDKSYQNVYPGALGTDGTRVALLAYNSTHDRRNLFNQTDLTYRLATGPLQQTFLVGADVGRQTTDNFRETGYFNDSTTSTTVPFDRPTGATPVTFRQSPTDADNRVITRLAAVYAQNQVRVGARLQVIAGVRYDRFDLEFNNHRNGEQLRRRDGMLSPRAGLVLKPAEPVSLYAAYSISHLPSSGDQFSSLTATTRTLEPERFTNREVGLKWEPGPDLAITSAVYQLDRTNTSAPDPLDAARLVQTGRQRASGWEAGIAGNIGHRWQMAGGYAWQTARIVSATSTAKAGATVPLVPRNMVSLWNRFAITQRLAGALGVVYQADMYAAIDNGVTLPGFTRLDGAAYATLTPGLRLQLNVENLLDARYYATSHGNNNIMPGASRTVRLSVTATR